MALFHLSVQVIAALGVLFAFQGPRLGTGLCGLLLLANLFVDIRQPLQRRGERGFEILVSLVDQATAHLGALGQVADCLFAATAFVQEDGEVLLRVPRG